MVVPKMEKTSTAKEQSVEIQLVAGQEKAQCQVYMAP